MTHPGFEIRVMRTNGITIPIIRRIFHEEVVSREHILVHTYRRPQIDAETVKGKL